MSSASFKHKKNNQGVSVQQHDQNASDPSGTAQHTDTYQSPKKAHPSPDGPKTDVLRSRKKTPSSPEPNGAQTSSEMDLTESPPPQRRKRLRSPWYGSSAILATTIFALFLLLAIARSFKTRQRDPKGCSMSWMRPAFARFPDFDHEHTRLAKKYSLYLYREGVIDEDTRVKGIPVLFIPGNAGSYKQVRPLAAQAAVQYHEKIRADEQAKSEGRAPLDFFTVDFNEDFAALHGRTLFDQAEYVNDAISYILALYHNPHRSIRESGLADPSSVILIGHSMGGIVARTALTLQNYQYDSVNTIVTLAAPHARAPISFDSDILAVYKQINDYWRYSYSQKQEANNPLWDTTLVSIAGGSLDTIVPSDYSAIASLVPPTHGFTVFTSSIPEVWVSMDHLAITWCNQLRKAIVAALYDVVNAQDPSQTKDREDRMTAFKKHLLTGLEDIVDDITPTSDEATLLIVNEASSNFLPPGERLRVRKTALPTTPKPHAYLMPIPAQGSNSQDMFRLITNQQMSEDGIARRGEIFLCKMIPKSSSDSPDTFLAHIDLSGDEEASTRLACYSTSPDEVLLPSSSKENIYPFDHYFDQSSNQLQKKTPPLVYLQYDIHALAEFEFVAFIDRNSDVPSAWVEAEFISRSETAAAATADLTSLFFHGLHLSLPSKSMLHEISIPSIHSSLMAFHIKIARESCADKDLFSPLLRQHVSEPYESKFVVNANQADINIHGVAPYIPTPINAQDTSKGLSLQIWSDPFCKSPLDITMKVDTFGSLGKLWMRYRTVFAAFPLLIVALVLRKQFMVHDDTGTFITFFESLDLCLRGSIPLVLSGLTFLGLILCYVSVLGPTVIRLGYAPESFTDFTNNEFLLGLQDPIFWYLTPLFGIIGIGVCALVNLGVLGLTAALATANKWVRRSLSKSKQSSNSGFNVTPLRRRLVILAILLFLVSTVVPYQFVYLVLCIIQISTCIRAFNIARDTQTSDHVDFYNYVHAVLMLILWILPINAPTLIVWIHNLAVYKLTPFTSHHSIFAIAPFIVLVQTLSTGNPIPQLRNNPLKHITNLLFLYLAIYTAAYGVSYAYSLHSIANLICAWLIALHMSANGVSLEGLRSFVRDINGGGKLFRSRSGAKEALS